MLIGYEAALGVHAIDEPFDLAPGGAFTNWLHEQRGIASSLNWAAEIERTTPDGESPIEEFFRLLDNYRRETRSASTSRAGKADPPGIEFMQNTFVA
ncbi:hypothetical protein ACFRKB_09105 [Streptomyces scopuliridis]|uniref:hypothetical protein n=1 Tax=Streptomyces scopuliridis TaxID=452529 RepID=UPI0036B53796